MALPISRATFTLQDYDNEKTNLAVWGVDITGANLATQAAQVAALETAILNLVRGSIANVTITASSVSATPVVTDALADRETKWLVRYHDNTNGKKYTVELGTADLALRTSNSEFLDLTGTEAAAFVTAFEAYARSPFDSGHLVTVDSIQSVGRRS